MHRFPRAEDFRFGAESRPDGGLGRRDLVPRFPPYDELPHDNIGYRLTITTAVLTSVATVSVIARIYGRTCILRIIGWDDYCMIIATVFGIAMTTICFFSVKAGIGQHIWDLPDYDLKTMLKFSYSWTVAHIIGLGFTKASLLLQLLRLAPSPRMRIIIWSIFCLSGFTTIATFVAWTVMCGPAPDDLDGKTVQEFSGEHCQAFVPLQASMTSVNIFTDFVVWLVPIRMVWQIKLPRPEKTGLLIVFSLGALVWGASIIRLLRIIGTSKGFLRDPPYRIVTVIVWSAIELQMAIICSSIPTIRPTLRLFFSGILGTNTSGHYSGQSRPVHVSISTYHSQAETSPMEMNGATGSPGRERYWGSEPNSTTDILTGAEAVGVSAKEDELVGQKPVVGLV